MLTALVLLGILTKSIAARFYIATLLAAVMLFTTIGKFVVMFGRDYPLIGDLVRQHGAPIGIVFMVIGLAIYVWGRRLPRDHKWRETTELCALLAILALVDIGIGVVVARSV